MTSSTYTMIPGTIAFKVVEWLKAHQRMLPAGEKFKASLAVIGEAIGHEGDLNPFLSKVRKHGLITSEPTAHKYRLWMLGDGVPLQPCPEVAAFDAKIDGLADRKERPSRAAPKLAAVSSTARPDPEPDIPVFVPRAGEAVRTTDDEPPAAFIPVGQKGDPWPRADAGDAFMAGQTLDGCIVIQRGELCVQFDRSESRLIARASRGLE
jgi:hypothetical protein